MGELHIVTPLRVPDGLDADDLADHLPRPLPGRNRSGQGPLGGSIRRIGTSATRRAEDVLAGLAALRATFADSGWTGDAEAAVEVSHEPEHGRERPAPSAPRP